MGKCKNQNKGYYWMLTAVEILSRYAFAIPVYRKRRLLVSFMKRSYRVLTIE